MKNQDLIAKYQDQIDMIAVHSKSIDFDIENGDIMDLVKSWLNMGNRLSRDINDNKNEVLILMKHLCQK